MPLSVRLNPATQAKIRRLARTTGRSKSEVVRDAVTQYGEERDLSDGGRTESALDRLRPFLGVIATGTSQYSTDTHAKYRAKLARKLGARRPR